MFVPGPVSQECRVVMCDSPSRPLVSIVIASYNRAQLVARAVRSALAQTYPCVEVIVSDDCSPDDTLAVLATIKDDRLYVHPQPKNAGCWGNWTAAVRCARGEFLIFLGDDDELTPNFVETHLAAFAALPAVSVVFCPMEELTLEGKRVYRWEPSFAPGMIAGGDTILKSLLEVGLFFGAAMFRLPLAVKVWEETQPDGMVADWGLMLRLSLLHKIDVTSCAGCTYRKTVHRGRLSNRPIEVTGLIIDLFERMLPHCSSSADRARLRRLAAWERVNLARHYAALRSIKDCRAELWRCARNYPWFGTLWKQIIQSYVWPSRLIRSSRQQRGIRQGAGGS